MARVHAYPELDSVVWTSRERVPSAEQVLAFDENAGSMVVVDSRGAPVRVDFRLGGVMRQATPGLTHLASADGWSVFGVAAGGRVVRLTPIGGAASSGWSFTPPAPPTRLAPQPDGSLLVISERPRETRIFRLRPPDTTVFASAELPAARGMAVSGVGDRIFLVADTSLVALRPRDLTPAGSHRIRGDASGAVSTPSGDRVYLMTEGGREISVFDRYRQSVVARIALPGSARELRMDPTGRALLVRPSAGDSLWVVSLANDQLVGSATSTWRADLPALAQDGAVAVVRGRDVALLDPQSLALRQTISGGAASVWYFFSWSGFRPRPADEEPQDFAEPIVPEQEAPEEFEDAPPEARQPRPVTPVPDPAPRPAPEARGTGYVVQFGALRSEDAARELAAEIQLPGTTLRVVLTRREGIEIYRVLAGPYATREEADRVGRQAGRSYWVYEDLP